MSRTRDSKGKRIYSPAAQAKRTRKFLEGLAKRENPIRFLAALPADIDLTDISWMPDHFEKLADLLRLMKARWEREDEARRQQRLKEIMAAVEADRKAGLLS